MFLCVVLYCFEQNQSRECLIVHGHVWKYLELFIKTGISYFSIISDSNNYLYIFLFKAAFVAEVEVLHYIQSLQKYALISFMLCLSICKKDKIHDKKDPWFLVWGKLVRK